MNAEDLKAMGDDLQDLLKLKTLPFGMKLYEDPAEMENIKGLRRPKPGREHSTCQLVTQVRINGWTLGILKENVRGASNCGGVLGIDTPAEHYLTGENMNGVWFDNQEAARLHQEQMPRVPAGKYHGVVASPLRAARLDLPDIVLFYASPGQMILFINGLQFKTYQRYDFSITGESACADSWGRALKEKKVSLSIPCFAERRYGGVADEEMLMACPPEDFARGIEGLKGLYKNGLRYPYMPYGANMNPQEGMDVSYG